MKTIIGKDFMLKNDTAKRLYHEHAENLPIIDYHCHISPKMIAEDHRFRNLTELMLGGDHYKWRLMRTTGTDEKYITGESDDFDKFKAFAESLEYAPGNPLYHWTHLELARYFNIDEALTSESARRIYDRANELLADPGYSARGLIMMSNVEVICTTDDPCDSLSFHKSIKESGFPVKVLPSFRPDKAIGIGADTFIPYMKELGVSSYSELLSKLSERVRFFYDNGCRVSDHALEYVPFAVGDAEKVFDKKLSSGTLTREEEEIFATALLRHLCGEYVKYGFVINLHIGALRNNNSRMFEKMGPDTGFDSIADHSLSRPLAKLLDLLDRDGVFPKTILYSLSPKDNYTLASMLGNFQAEGIFGKMQLGSGWWFNDQRDGMEAQLKALANLGVLGTFIGMLTDSRSFVSYPRHEYFRRILCSLIGKWIEDGEYPDSPMAGKIIERISYLNAKEYFDFG